MLFDKIVLMDGSEIINLVVPSGSSYPSVPNLGELFYLAGTGLQIYDGTEWSSVTSATGGSGGTSFTSGTGISLVNGKISCTIKPAGSISTVQINDGAGNFAAIPAGADQHVLTSNGPGQVPTWEPAQVSGGTVTSVGISGGTTGLTASAPVTQEGTITLDGVITLEHGGTGATTKQQAQINILPSQSGKTGGALVTDGSGNLSWVVQPGSTYTVGTGLQFNVNNPTKIESKVADNTGAVNYLQVSNGDGTLSNLPAGTSGYVLVSNGNGQLPTWQHKAGTVSKVSIGRDVTMGLYLNVAGGDTYTEQDGLTKSYS